MIRRQVGQEFYLFTQHDHAVLSGELAKRLGNRPFSGIEEPDVLLAISLHDCGWPLHDDAPTINDRHQPSDVFETQPKTAFKVWPASAQRASEHSPYAGLLVSLHVLALSAMAMGGAAASSDARVRFELNRFQHGEIERQEQLRKQLGMALDRPLRLGLSEDQSDLREQRLTYHLRLLQAMDKLSLDLCCTKPPNPRIEPVIPSIGAAPMSLDTRRSEPFHMIVDPWPFAPREVLASIPFRGVPVRPYTSDDDLRTALAAMAVQSQTMRLLPPRAPAVRSRP